MMSSAAWLGEFNLVRSIGFGTGNLVEEGLAPGLGLTVNGWSKRRNGGCVASPLSAAGR